MDECRHLFDEHPEDDHHEDEGDDVSELFEVPDGIGRGNHFRGIIRQRVRDDCRQKRDAHELDAAVEHRADGFI